MANSLVEYSRAGDVFHYRWAARRCLQLVYPHTKVNKIVIEGSDDGTKEGEYVIDVAEYSEESGTQQIDYYQLKHSTTQVDDPFTLSDLEDTVTGFAKRFSEWKDKAGPSIGFTIITNRKIADSFRDGIKAISESGSPQQGFRTTIEKYTGLTGDELRAFCQIFRLEDSEGNYEVQQEELRSELAKLVADPVDNVQVVNLVGMIQERVLPNSRNTIVAEDVLRRFGITSKWQLYPAPAELEPATNVIELPQYGTLKDDIDKATTSVIIHAEGGVGKSVFCKHLVQLLPPGSMGIIYDCFGAGKYRNRSEPRHEHRQALTQIINELASKNLCAPLLLSNTSREEDIMRRFLESIKAAVESLQKVVASAKLLILVDAADNAEMAAAEFNDNCFVQELIREQIPIGCQLVFLCRTERIDLLKPSAEVRQLKLLPFSETETLRNLRMWFPDASDQDGKEFHRLTNSNPRVQANALNAKYESIQTLLASLGPGGTSIEKLIESQLFAAVDKVKRNLAEEYQRQIDAICVGLALLPPHIPISVLSRASTVDESTIKSFVSDIGRSLWILDSSVQFRDEPTETWFRNRFLGRREDYESYLQLLEPLSRESTYAAEVLPQLYLQAEQYDKLIQVSLTDDFLPTDNPIDARTIRVYRLQFAFKAALKTKRIADAIQVAIKAGEEVAGNQRQLQLLQENIDLLLKLQSKDKVQEIAFKQQLRGTWDGSENVYAASLLSGIEDYRGEARGCLRSAVNWLRIAIEEARKRRETNEHYESGITRGNIVEIAYAMLNLEGAEECTAFLSHLNPDFVFGVMQRLTSRLMDEGRFSEIDQLIASVKGDVHCTVAIVSMVMQLGIIPNSEVVGFALDLLCNPKTRIEKPQGYSSEKVIPDAIVTFAECCMALNLSRLKILWVLRHYIPTRADRIVGNDMFSDERGIFLRALSIRMIALDETEPTMERILPTEHLKANKSYDEQNALTEFNETVFGVLPWYQLRLKVLMGEKLSLMDAARDVQKASGKAKGQRYRSRDNQPQEIAFVSVSIVTFLGHYSNEDITAFYDTFLKPKDTLSLGGKLELLNAAGRLKHLTSIRAELEETTRKIIRTIKGDGPDAIASRYIALARAVLTVDPADARVYFDHAIEIASKFGDEVVQRWESIVALAEQASDNNVTPDSLAYRFIRCAEVVGETVSREKHWSRYDAMRVCTQMSPGIGLSATSRWRDRDIGDFHYELMSSVNQLLDSKKIDSSVAWALSRFFSSQSNEEFLRKCLVNTTSQPLRQQILKDEIHLNRTDGVDISYWVKMKVVAEEFIEDANFRKETFSFLDNVPDRLIEKKEIAHEHTDVTRSSIDWDNIFKDANLSTTEGFEELVKRYQDQIGDEGYGNPIRDLLSECVRRVNPALLDSFFDALFGSSSLNEYDVQQVLESIPTEWKQKVSFPARWFAIIRKYSECYAQELCNTYRFNSLVRAIHADKDLQIAIIEGMNKGLIDAKDLNSADTFFAYAELSARSVTDREARHLLDYGLQRFERHFETDAGDGPWSSWLEVPGDINRNIAGVIWVALGSPRAAERWKAVHCTRLLFEFDCSAVLKALMECAEHNSVGAFGSQAFPFYHLHAHQYLLISLARVAKDRPAQLVQYRLWLKKCALEFDHILIQKFAADTCLSIEAKLPGTFDEETLEKLLNITKSKFPVREEKKHQYHTESYWHANKLVDEKVEHHFAWDFDRYWYQPLGEVFGVSEKQVEDLAAMVLIKEWKIEYTGENRRDPRTHIWNRYSSDRETWHDHGSYPKVDDLDFYLSYHAMLVVAGRLLQKMPVLSSSYEDGNTWDNWLSRHLLTRKDGKWLADHRDPVPILRPAWISGERKSFDDWKSSIAEMDFVECIMPLGRKRQLTVKGGWHEKDNERIETFYVTSAIVSKTASDALLRAWSTASDHHDYKVPDYEEEQMEFDLGVFNLKGWIIDPNNEQELDEFDPYANKIEYPSYQIGESFLEVLKLRVDMDGKQWFDQNNERVATCETWSSSPSSRDEENDQAGMRLEIDLAEVKKLCHATNSELIIEVSITRRLSYSQRSHREERDVENDQHRIFILNENGELRTIGKNYSLG